MNIKSIIWYGICLLFFFFLNENSYTSYKYRHIFLPRIGGLRVILLD